MKIMLLCSSFNGLSQRAWIELRDRGHDVRIQLAGNPEDVSDAVATMDPDLIVCPFLRQRVPHAVWRKYPTIVIHPGPVGDRGPSSLDWAIADVEPTWGVTALQAIDEMDAGPIWATRTFDVPFDPPSKSALYNGAVTDAAIDVIEEVVAKAADASFVPMELDYERPDVLGRLRPTMKQSDRAFDWSDATAGIVRRIRAADGTPGVRSRLCGVELSVFDAHVGPRCSPGRPGTIAQSRHGAVLVRTGDGAVWIGHVRPLAAGPASAIKVPAVAALRHQLVGVPDSSRGALDGHGYREIEYCRIGDVGVLSFDFYNGAFSTAQCRRLTAAVRQAAALGTRVLVIRGGQSFCNGIHLNVIEAAARPADEAWLNINAIDDVCREIITCTDQLVVTSVAGNAGAGGVMLALGGDEVVLRQGVVLNPHYKSMGLFGSEYWTYVLPRRVGEREAARITDACLPLGARGAERLGVVDGVFAGDVATFEAAVLDHAQALASASDYAERLDRKRLRRRVDECAKPLDNYRTHELMEMLRDMFDDRSGFEAARRNFVFKGKPPRQQRALRPAGLRPRASQPERVASPL